MDRKEGWYYEGTLRLSQHVDYFHNGDSYFVYHNLFGYILRMSEDLVDFLEFFRGGPQNADAMHEQFGMIFSDEPLKDFISVFRSMACLLPDDTYETRKLHEMYPNHSSWVTADQTNPDNIVLYAFDSQTQNQIFRLSLDAWDSRLWLMIDGARSVQEIAETLAEKDSADVSEILAKIDAALKLWVHYDMQAVKMADEPNQKRRKSRYVVTPYLISTMPYKRVTVEVRTPEDEDDIIPPYEDPAPMRPENMTVITLDDETLRLDRRCTRMATLMAKPHAVLDNRSYGRALYDVLSGYVPISGDTFSVLDVGAQTGETARDFVLACRELHPNTKLDYVLFIPDADEAEKLKSCLADIQEIRVVTGEIDKIHKILDGSLFDLIFSNEFLACLKSEAARRVMPEAEDVDIETVLKTGEYRSIHATDDKLTFMGEGDSVSLILKYKLNLGDAPDDFILNSGSIKLLANLTKLLRPDAQLFLIEFGEDIKYPIQTFEEGKACYSQHFGVLKQVARKLGFMAQSSYWMEELSLKRDLPMFATTRSQFKAMRQMLADHGADLERKPYTTDEMGELMKAAGRKNVIELNFEPAEDRISGLVPHSYKMLRVFKDSDF